MLHVKGRILTTRLRPQVAFLLLAVIAAGTAVAAAQAPELPATLPLDMSVWHRRDYARCSGAGRVTQGGNTITIEADHSALKYWQVPTLVGPLPINERWGWIRRCDRPPGSFVNEARRQAEADQIVIRVADYPYVSWRWRIEGTVDDSRTADPAGKILSSGDDFAAKIGFQMLPEEGNDLREIAYVWTRSIPLETTLVQESGALFWHYKFYRIVAESGDEHVGEWRTETRNLYEEYKRIWPDEEPGVLMRIFLMTDGDNTGTKAVASYADIVLHRNPPGHTDTDR
jgi:hypothetical protein